MSSGFFSIFGQPETMYVSLALAALFLFLYIRLRLDSSKIRSKFGSKPLPDIVLEFDQERQEIHAKYEAGQEHLNKLNAQLAAANSKLEGIDYGILPPIFSYDDSEELKAKIRQAHDKQLEAIKSDKAVESYSDWDVFGSKEKGRKLVDAYRRLLLRAFNNEFDSIRKSMRHSTRETAEAKLDRLYEALEKLGDVARVSVTFHYLSLKSQELDLWHAELVKKQRQKEERKRQQAILREQANLGAVDTEEIEDEIEFKNAQLEKARKLALEFLGAENAQKSKEVAKLEKELISLRAKQERAISQAQITKAGYIYVISNHGCFGENVVKIGMTRRLEPMDRVVELGDASVPFRFDVHTLTFVQNAPEIESKLHAHFDEKRVNKANNRKEFFYATPDEVQKAMVDLGINADWYFDVEAREFRESELMRKAAKENKKPEYSYSDGLPASI